MDQKQSCVLLSTPTSGTGSLWRILGAVGHRYHRPEKICEMMEGAGQGHLIPDWIPESHGRSYLYNTPHRTNLHLLDPNIKLITNFRDPRDLVCNQFFWALQHPILNKSEQDIADFRKRIEEDGIDAYALRIDNEVQFQCFKALRERLFDGVNTLNLSYSQLCLDFDGLVTRMMDFLEIPREDVLWDLVESQRSSNLPNNTAWIGQMWTGTDVSPGRHRRELAKETITKLDARHRDTLEFLRALEAPPYRIYLATDENRSDMQQVLFGSNGYLFLQNDANDTVAQITGRFLIEENKLSQIALVHRGRQLLGETILSFKYMHAVIPSKEVAGRLHLPSSVVFQGEGLRPIERYLSLGLGDLWNPIYRPDVMASNFEKYFPVTDTHWNHEGALAYLQAVLDEFDTELAEQLTQIQRKTYSIQQSGDLGLKLGMQKEAVEVIAAQQTSARSVFCNEITNEGCVRWFRNDSSGNTRRAIILHDSFSLWFLSFLPELFSEVFMLHGTCLDVEFLRSFNPTDVLCFQAERFFPRVPMIGAELVSFVTDEERRKGCKNPLAEFLGSRQSMAESL